MKTLYRVALLLAATALLLTSLPVHAATTDERIEASAKTTYVFQKYLKDDAITVTSKGGAVTLTGSVAEEHHKALAQDTVEGLPGVKSVDNRLEIKGESAAANSDAWVTMKVKTALLFHRNVSARTEVDTKDGIVTLRGESASTAQKDLTTEYVKDVEGVKGVQNEMTAPDAPAVSGAKSVAAKVGAKAEDVAEAIDDASITALVKMTLMYHRSTSAHHTKVKTKNGQVTLSGTARSAAEKDLVSKYTEDVYGVKGVSNKITVK